MSDQMPDKVWIERPRWDGWGEYTTKRVENPRVHRVRYIRADLYEQAGEFDYQGIDPADLGQHFTDAMQALTTRNAVSKAACAQLIAEQAQRAEQAEAELDEWKSRFAALEVNWLKDTEQCEQAEAARGRLRADIQRALPRLHEAMRHVRIEQWPAVHNALDAMRDLEEALDHD